MKDRGRRVQCKSTEEGVLLCDGHGIAGVLFLKKGFFFCMYFMHESRNQIQWLQNKLSENWAYSFPSPCISNSSAWGAHAPEGKFIATEEEEKNSKNKL